MALADTFADFAQFARDGSFAGGRSPRLLGFDVPPRVTLGETIVFSWRTLNCDGVSLNLRGARPLNRHLVASGAWQMVAVDAGVMRAELQLWSGGRVVARHVREITVVAPAVKIDLSQTELRGAPGAMVRMAWFVEGAQKVVIQRPMTGEELDVFDSGAVDLVLDALTESVHVIATGHDGGVMKATCRLMPRHGAAPTDIAAELDWLNSPWEGI